MSSINMSFHSLPPNPTLDCGICLESLEQNVVAHEGEGNKHPLHKNCIKKWVQLHPLNPTCPSCFANVNPNSLLSLREQMMNYCKKVSELTRRTPQNSLEHLQLKPSLLLIGISCIAILHHEMLVQHDTMSPMMATAGLICVALGLVLLYCGR